MAKLKNDLEGEQQNGRGMQSRIETLQIEYGELAHKEGLLQEEVRSSKVVLLEQQEKERRLLMELEEKDAEIRRFNDSMGYLTR